MFEDYYDFEDCDDYDDYDEYSDYDVENFGCDSVYLDHYEKLWNEVLDSTKRFTAIEAQTYLCDLRHSLETGVDYIRVSKYCQLIERFYEKADSQTYNMFQMSILYSLSALIMEGRPLLSINDVCKTKLKSLDKRIKSIYDISFSRYCSHEIKIMKTPIIPFSDSSETGSISIKKSSLCCEELLYEIQAASRDVVGANSLVDFVKSIEYLEKAFGHYKLRIPKNWIAVNHYSSDEDDNCNC